MILYHGSQSEHVQPTYGLGSTTHDYGAGFYLTDSKDLASEWSVYRPNAFDGWIHAFELPLNELRVFDFRTAGVLPWVAELMRHRDADESSAYKRRAPLFIRKYGVDLSDYDVIVGWRADASYFYIVKAFVRDEVDVGIMDDLLRLGGFGIQYAIKTPRAFASLIPLPELRERTSFAKGHPLFEARDAGARTTMRNLIADASFNKLERLFSDLVREGVE